MIIVRIETADTVEIGSAAFSEGIGEGEAEREPVVIAGGYVCLCGFNALNYLFYVGCCG